MRFPAELKSEETGLEHVMQLLDYFDIEGANGKHECLVLEFLGPSERNVMENCFKDQRLPGPLAKMTAKQALLGLAYLHKNNIGHGGMIKAISSWLNLADIIQIFTLGI